MKDQLRSQGPVSGVSRRAFLKGSGAVAAATAITGAAATADAADAAVVAGPQKITLNVNGKAHQLEVEPRTTLLDALRYQLDLTGAKPVSIDGSCGAATVIIDGKPASATTLLAIACAGKQIRTVESLGGEKLNAVPAEFVHADAQQCGFCTPGFVVGVRAFLDKYPQATEQQIREGLNGNLCRCGTYANVIQAALAVVKGGSRG